MIAKHFYGPVNAFNSVRLYLAICNFFITLVKFSGPFGGPGYHNQEREKHFEHLTPNMSKTRNGSAFSQDEINSHREHFRVSLIPPVSY
jgi:hypothetical protein